MKINFDKQYLKISLYAFLTIALSILFYLSLGNLGNFLEWSTVKFTDIRKILSSVIMAISIAYILNPGVRWFEVNVYNRIGGINNSKKLSRILSIITIYLFLFGLISMVIVFVAPQIATSMADISRRVPEYINSTIEIVEDLSNRWSGELNAANQVYDIAGHVERNINQIFINAGNILDYVFNNLILGIMSITSGIFNFILGIIISFYLLGDKESFKRGTEKILLAIFHKKTVIKIKDLGREADTLFGKYVIGKFVDSLIIGIICFIGLSILKIRYALLISSIIGITNMIPYFGPFIGAVPAVIITFFDSPMNALWIIIFILILQQFDGLILGPKILGDSVGLKPFWIIFSIVLGGGLYGVLGMFLGVPVMAIIVTFGNKLIDWQIERKTRNIE